MPYKKLRIVFLLIILLPTIIFSVYEFGAYRENEKVIETIYGNQLDAILYSINQYSEDVLSSWANEIEEISYDGTKNNSQLLSSFKAEALAIDAIFQFNSEQALVFKDTSGLNIKGFEKEIDSLLLEKKDIISQLTRYLEEGYRKIEPFYFEKHKKQLLLFIVETESKLRVNIVVVDSERFITHVLDPKIQEIAQDKFNIGAYYKWQNNPIYNSDHQGETRKYEYRKAFWLLNDYYLGIELKNQTINELVKSRARKNILLIIIIDLVLLFGAWLIYRNIKKQMELAQIKSDFISNVSHEIRTPLALISMYVETLDMNRVKTEKKKKEYYQVIFQETKRLSNMVNNILNFSKIENNKRKYVFAPVDINTRVQEVLGTFSFHLESNNFEIDTDYNNDLPQINGDEDALTELIVNIIDNAIKYSGDKKYLGIKTGVDKQHAYIEISDKGVGIPELEQKRIFEKFYRVAEKDLAYKANGAGLGLAIVKHVVDAHGGSVRVKSKINEGTSFRLKFPLEKINRDE